jgi:protein gp37
MGAATGIKWTDSTFNSWWGCTKVGPACDDCYAEAVDKRTGESHWGHGAPRRLLSERARNEPYRWQKQADKFFAEHGRDRRVFTLSMGDLFDNEIDPQWRSDHMGTMEACDRLQWQICTKRISNLPKMIWPRWEKGWPQHIGVLVTVVTQAEAERDIPRLLDCKRRFGMPWVGISYEPAQEMIDFSRFLHTGPHRSGLDWIIFGGKSGPRWNDRPFDIGSGYQTADMCEFTGTAFFMKQVAAFRPTDAMIPADLMIRQWPEGH